MKLHTASLLGLDEIRAFLEGSDALGFEPPARSEAYAWIAEELRMQELGRMALT